MDFLRQLRDLPRRYLLPDGGIDYALAMRDLGIETEEDQKNFLLQLYRLDATVNHHVNARVLYFLLGEKVKGKLPVLEVPPAQPLAWIWADGSCERCPGSEVVEHLPGVRLPLCGNPSRIERWESCMKYRENLRAAAARIDADDPQVAAEAREAAEAACRSIDEFERAADRLIADVIARRSDC